MSRSLEETRAVSRKGVVFAAQNLIEMLERALPAADQENEEHGEGAAHRHELGTFASSCTAIAAENPYAWFRERRTADQLMTVTDTNRMIGFPYPKLLNAIMEVDQSAGVLIASVKKARELDPLLQVIIITAFGDVQTAVDAMKHGACVFVRKPYEMEDIVLAVDEDPGRDQRPAHAHFVAQEGLLIFRARCVVEARMIRRGGNAVR